MCKVVTTGWQWAVGEMRYHCHPVVTTLHIFLTDHLLLRLECKLSPQEGGEFEALLPAGCLTRAVSDTW